MESVGDFVWFAPLSVVQRFEMRFRSLTLLLVCVGCETAFVQIIHSNEIRGTSQAAILSRTHAGNCCALPEKLLVSPSRGDVEIIWAPAVLSA